MATSDAEPIIIIALMAALADGTTSATEEAELQATITRLGITSMEGVARQIAGGQLKVAEVARRLSDDSARRAAWETALAVCHADGSANEDESSFLRELRSALGIPEAEAAGVAGRAAGMSSIPVVAAERGPGSQPALDQYILEQAMLTGALELLPDGLANIVILPVQLRLVYQIGQQHGQKFDANQAKDLMATLGLGAAAQVMEGIVRKVLGGVTKGLLGGLLGGATGFAAGAAVTFGATYALGHAADQYYAQGRRLSQSDLRALFLRFQEEGKALFPKVQEQVQTQARSLNLQKLLASLGNSTPSTS